MNSQFYEPEVDTYLLLEVLNSTLKAKSNSHTLSICEIGVGSGYILSNLQKEFTKHNYFGTDINIDAVIETKNQCPKADIRKGSLFEPFENKTFDIIYFNTPYLPCESGESIDELEMIDKAIYGGKKGYEVILNFLRQVREHMHKKTQIFMLFSTRSKPHVIDEFLDKNAFEYEKVGSKEVFFEEIIVYKITNKSSVNELQEKGVSHLSYLSRGKHSIVLQGKYEDDEVVCKIEDKSFVGKEGFFLKKLQGLDFMPKLYFYDKEYIVMEKINGIILEDIYKKLDTEQIKEVFNAILQATQELDKLGLQKFEMLNPYKHIFIQKDLSIKFIDFERMIYAKNPKNTTQFLEYLRRKEKRLAKVGVEIDTKKLEEIAKNYKTSQKNIEIEDIVEVPLELSKETLKNLEISKEDIRKGRIYSHEEVKKKLKK